MGLSRYMSTSNALATELADSLPKEGICALAEAFRGVSVRKWLAWCEQHADFVEEYVAATPSQRKRKKEWNTSAFRRGSLVLAAPRHCLAAERFLDTLYQHEHRLAPGGSYRDTTALAGRLFQELRRTDIPLWPEEWERYCDSPFDHEQA